MSDAWWPFIQSLNPSTVEANALPPLGRVLRERFGGPDHAAMLVAHEINRAKFHAMRERAITRLATQQFDLAVTEAAHWKPARTPRKPQFTEQQMAVAMRVAGKKAA